MDSLFTSDEYDPIRDYLDEQELAKKVKEKEDRLKSALLRILSTKEGRMVLSMVLDITGFFGSVSQTDAITMAVSSGRRDVGVQLYALLEESHPDLLDKLLKERREDV